jgi:hypothetical protein
LGAELNKLPKLALQTNSLGILEFRNSRNSEFSDENSGEFHGIVEFSSRIPREFSENSNMEFLGIPKKTWCLGCAKLFSQAKFPPSSSRKS